MLIQERTTIYFIAVLLLSVICQAEDAQNLCHSKSTCKDCIQTASCAWCEQPNPYAKDRCFNVTNYEKEATCPENYIWNPENSQRITLNRAFIANTEEIVRISPQRTTIKLRTNQKYQMKVRYCAANDSSVEISDNANDFVKIKYYSACQTDELHIPTNTCNNLKIRDVVNFIVEMEVLHCPKNPEDWFQTFHIFPVGINENLVVDLEVICDCPCEKNSSPTYQENSNWCNSKGTYKCGICDCQDGYYGKRCECFGGSYPHMEDCTYSNTSATECYGRGTCVCGHCECERRLNPDELIFGKYCECDNFSCDRNNGLICSGPSNGICECGSCLCYE